MTPNGNGHSQRDPISPGHDAADYKYGRFDASALHIAHALKQTEIQKSYNKGDKPINLYLVSLTWTFAHQSKMWRKLEILFVYISGIRVRHDKSRCALFPRLHTHTRYRVDYDWEEKMESVETRYKKKSGNGERTIDC